jgi:hypothetical protein
MPSLLQSVFAVISIELNYGLCNSVGVGVGVGKRCLLASKSVEIPFVSPIVALKRPATLIAQSGGHFLQRCPLCHCCR